ncbi:MAG: erythromycin esterase family protein [Pseudomonadota bacterium]
MSILLQISFILYLCAWQLMYSLQAQELDTATHNIEQLNFFIHPIAKSLDFQLLISQYHQPEIILIGDSTHGTHEFYQQRIKLSKNLILKHDFKLIAIEANWPDSYILNQYIQSEISYSTLKKVNPFKAYPRWMWRNQESMDFLHWLRAYNSQLPKAEQTVSLYGIDLYSYYRSINWLIDYFAEFYPDKLNLVRSNYNCLSQYKDPGDYGVAVNKQANLSCQQAVIEVFNLFVDCKISCINFTSQYQQQAFFHAQQQAFIVTNNEKYYRSMYRPESGAESWNIRDRYMFESLLTIREHLHQPKTLVFAHSSHLGDARATAATEYQQLNLGQLLRQHYKQQLFSIGMLSYTGELIASDGWGQATIKKQLKPAHKKSIEYLFHQLNSSKFFLVFKQLPEKLRNWLNKQRMERHVGVVYLAETEFENHYGGTQLVEEFDAILFFDTSSALNWFENF